MKTSLNRRLTVWILVILLLTEAVSLAWNLYSTRRSILDMEERQVEGCAQIIASMLGHYGLKALQGDRDTREYSVIRYTVRSLCRGFSQTRTTMYTVDPQTGERRVLLAVAADPDLDAALAQADYSKADSETLGLPFSGAEEELLSGENNIQREKWTPATGGAQLSWLALYRSEDGSEAAIICTEYSLDRENQFIIRDFREDMLLPIIALGLAFLILNILILRRVVRPIRLISGRMESFARDSSRKPEPLNLPFSDEIGEIASSFEKMTGDISSYVANMEALTRERVETNVQLETARRIQCGLVPEKAELRDHTFCLSAMTRPARAVGGDFYDFFRRDGGCVCLFIGDVSGKGITGAIFMALIKTILREKMAAGLSPAEALNQANGELTAQNPEGLFVTVFAAVLNPSSGELVYANAGHNPPVLLGVGGAPAVLKPNIGIALGLFDDAEVVDEALTLHPGQGIFFYTDGVTEAVDQQSRLFGLGRLQDALGDLRPSETNPAEDTLRLVSRAISAFCEGSEPFDDLTALALFLLPDKNREAGMTAGAEKALGANAAAADQEAGETAENPESERDAEAIEENWPLLHALPVDQGSFAEIRDLLFETAGDTPKTRKALLACDEALSNIVRYSGATVLSFGCEKQEARLHVLFLDNGIPFDPTAAQTEEKDFEQLDSGGMGLEMIRKTVSSMAYGRRSGRNLFLMDFPL